MHCKVYVPVHEIMKKETSISVDLTDTKSDGQKWNKYIESQVVII